MPAQLDELDIESPYGRRPNKDVACPDCGFYRKLYGPINEEGERIQKGDMVCEKCALKRGVRITSK
jgi:hypothetical protein